jgi:hypothetical protein
MDLNNKSNFFDNKKVSYIEVCPPGLNQPIIVYVYKPVYLFESPQNCKYNLQLLSLIIIAIMLFLKVEDNALPTVATLFKC